MDSLKDLQQNLAKISSRPMGVAFSGGKDSVILTSLLLDKLKPEEIFLLHINHNVRDEKSQKEENEFVEAFAQQFDLKWCRSESPKPTPKDEARLRKLRYRQLAEMGQKLNLDLIATAHHGDDQIETFLMRLLRGADCRGLSGMAQEITMNGQNFIRPLLHVRLHTLDRWRKERNLAYFEDPSNRKLIYFRNKIRHNLCPMMEDLSPGFGQRLLDLSSRLSDLNTYIDSVEKNELSHVQWEVMDNGEWRSARKPLQIAAKVLVRVWCRKSLAQWSGGEAQLSSKQIEALSEFIRSDALGYYPELFPGRIQLRARKHELIARKII